MTYFIVIRQNKEPKIFIITYSKFYLSLSLVFFFMFSLPILSDAQCLFEVNNNGYEYSVDVNLDVTDVVYTQNGTTCNVQIEVSYDIQTDVTSPAWYSGGLYNISGNLDCAGASGMSYFDLPVAGGTGTVLSATFSMDNEQCEDVVLDCPIILTISGPELNETVTCGSYVNATMPINLTSFGFENTSDEKIEINWTTQSEINFSHFELQQSSNVNNWESIGTVDGLNSVNGSNYSYTIPSTLNDKYLRLKIFNLDKQIEYSKVIYIPAIASNVINAYPNPTSDKLYIEGINADELTVINTMGQEVSLPVESDQYVNVETLVSGHYFINISNGNGRITTIRFVKH